MTLVIDKFRSLLPPKIKSSPSGWTSFNAPCCHHRGHKPDTRKRAGVRFDGNGVVYNCFNCKFSTGWQPGSPFGDKLKTLCRWMGAGEDTVKELVFEAMKTEGAEYRPEQIDQYIDFADKDLPEGSMSLKDWSEYISSEIGEHIVDDYANILAYLIDRGFENPLAHDFYWTPSPGFEDRVIIPFRWKGRIAGCTARKIRDGKPKYISDQHPQFVFNFDNQRENQKYLFVCEGPFDALAIGGVALLTNEISDQQARIINSLNSEVIVIPDQDQAGLHLIDRAIEYGWSVAFPTWAEGVKDTADAARIYGKLFTVVDAIKTSQKGEIKITMFKKKLEQKLSRKL